MNRIEQLRSLGILFIVAILMNSCVIASTRTIEKKDNGKHKGWYKNTNNPHHPNTTNPGKGNKK